MSFVVSRSAAFQVMKGVGSVADANMDINMKKSIEMLSVQKGDVPIRFAGSVWHGQRTIFEICMQKMGMKIPKK